MRQSQFSKRAQIPEPVEREAQAAVSGQIDPRLYFLMRRLAEFTRRRFPGEKISLLDVGCADGSFMKIISERLSDVVGCVDGADVPSRWLRQSAALSGGNLYLQDFQQGRGEVPEGKYHAVTMWEVIEHIENAYAMFRNIRQTLAPGGGVLLSSPNLLSVSRFLKGDRWIGTAEHDHKYLFDVRTLRMLLQRAGLVDVSVRAFFMPSLGPGADGCNKMLSRLPGGGMLFAEAFKSR